MSQGMNDADVMAQFGSPTLNDRQQGSFDRALKPVDNGAVEFGVMAQMADLRDDPYGWHGYNADHWGWRMPSRNDPTKAIKFTFRCIKKTGHGGKVLEECPACNKIDSMDDRSKMMDAKLMSEGRTEAERRELLAPLTAWLKNYNVERKEWLFVFQPDGTFNRLKLSWKTFQDLQKTMREVEADYKINPMSPHNLIMFRIVRTGAAKDGGGKISEKAEVAKERVTVDGQQLERVKQIKLSLDQMRAALDRYKTLGGLDSGARRLTRNQIQALVESNGDPEVVAQIVNVGVRTEAPALAPSAPAPAVAPPAASVKTAEVPISLNTGTHVATMVQAVPVPAQAATTTQTSSPPIPGLGSDNMTEEELFAKLGLSAADLAGPVG